MLLGYKAWWTEVTHVISQLSPANHSLTQCITGLAYWTPICIPLRKAGLPPLRRSQDQNSCWYSMRVLLAPVDRPGQQKLIVLLHTLEPKNKSMVGIKRIAVLLQDIFTTPNQMEDPSRHYLPCMTLPDITSSSKVKVGAAHMRWLQWLESGTILLYPDGSKANNGVTASVWHCGSKRQQGPTLLWLERKCQLGNQADIEDGEIHGIQEGLKRLFPLINGKECNFLCADNQNALCALWFSYRLLPRKSSCVGYHSGQQLQPTLPLPTWLPLDLALHPVP